MLTVVRLVVRSFFLDHLDLFWEIEEVRAPSSDSTTHEIFDYDFYILRSEAAMGPYDVVGGPFRDTYRFRDVGVQLLHKWRQFFYKIRVVHRRTEAMKEFGPTASLDAPPDLIAAEIIRQEDMLFREFIGRRCWLYPARTFGPRCSCFDTTLGRKTRGNHLPCFGTGWLGGYMSPVEVFVQFDPNPTQTQISQLRELQANNAAARMSSFPPVNPRDIVIESENRRWRVVSTTSTERLRAVVHQELQLHEIPRGDVEYSLPVHIDLAALQPSGARNFTNSSSIDNVLPPEHIPLYWDDGRGWVPAGALANPHAPGSAAASSGDDGIWVGDEPPVDPVTHTQWLETHKGHWAWVDTKI